MTDESIPVWDRLAGFADAAAKRGQWHQAAKLWGAARDAWLHHCESVEAELRGKRLAHRRKRAMEDWEYDRDLERGRGR